MKKLWIVALVAALVGGASVSYAGCGHCEKSKKEACAKSGCDKLLTGITLSDDQKAKISGIEKACDGSKEACAKAKDSIRAVLTEEQQKAFDANSAKSAKGACCDKEKA